MNIREALVLFIVSILLFSCNENKENSVVGLWLVKKVEVGKDEMTPNARWMNFKNDSTQTSGNGWLQHSVGNYKLNGNYLTIENSNGLKDSSEPFQVISLDDASMIWTRNEENQEVKVYLERIDKIPTSLGNKIMGLWKLDSYLVSEKDVTKKENPKNNQTLYLSWDNVFREHNLLSGRKTGIYKIHGHKPELQLINYGKNPEFSFWKFSLQKNELTLTSVDNKIIKKYHRIYKFLQ